MNDEPRSSQAFIIRHVATNDRGLLVGRFHPNAKISDQDVDKIREMHEEQGLGYKRIAKIMGLSRNTVAGICQYVRRAQTYELWKQVRVPVPSVCED